MKEELTKFGVYPKIEEESFFVYPAGATVLWPTEGVCPSCFRNVHHMFTSVTCAQADTSRQQSMKSSREQRKGAGQLHRGACRAGEGGPGRATKQGRDQLAIRAGVGNPVHLDALLPILGQVAQVLVQFLLAVDASVSQVGF